MEMGCRRVPEYLVQTPSESSDLFLGDAPLGRGGEGSVYAVLGHALDDIPPGDELVAKLYHDPGENDRVKKIIAMIKASPESDSLAWPLALVLKDGAFAGYVMRKLPQDTYRMWAELAHAQQRRESAEKFDVRYALTAALNFALTLSAVHDAGHAVGDVNESNIFIGNDASVLLVDTDSAQIKSGGKIFPCLVGKPEYTAPELSHGSLKDQRRTPETDVFAYAVAIYQLLTGGAHPTDGVYNGDGEPPSVVDKIRLGITPNLSKEKDFSPVKRVPTQGIPKALRELIKSALAVDPGDRPELYDFEVTLDEILDNLKHCSKVRQHWYDARDKRCGWCQHVKEGQPDPWVVQEVNLKKVQKQQKKLSPIKFNDGSGAGQKKAPRVKIGQGAPQGASPAGSGLPPTPGATRAPAPGGALQQPLSQVYKSKRIDMPKVKGKTVLSYGDGTSGQRPSLGSLSQVNSKLAYQCFVNEAPDTLRPSWKFGDSLPSKGNILVSALLGLMISLAWLVLVPIVVDATPLKEYSWLTPAVPYISYVAAGLSAGFVLLKLLLTLGEMGKIGKIAGQYNIPQTPAPKVIPQIPLGALFYGLPVIITALAVLLLQLLGFLLEAVTQGGSKR